MHQSEPIRLPVLLTYSALPNDQSRSCYGSNKLSVARDSKAADCGGLFALRLFLDIFVVVGSWWSFSFTLGRSVDSRSAQWPVHFSLGEVGE